MSASADRIEELERELDATTKLLDYASDKAARTMVERDALRVDYHRTCQTVAEMHAAAMGALVGPVRGVVEDVADLKAERDALQSEIAELVGALDRISEGDIGRPHKVEKCAHEKYGFEHCEECYCDFARAALAKVRKP